jgi:hypothetical protein
VITNRSSLGIFLKIFNFFFIRSSDKSTWPFVEFSLDLLWYERNSHRMERAVPHERGHGADGRNKRSNSNGDDDDRGWSSTMHVHPRDLCSDGPPPAPALSIVMFRWGVGQDINDWDYNSWGSTGSTVSDAYIGNIVEKALYPLVGANYEILNIFIERSADLARIDEKTISMMLSGRHVSAMYFLWVTAFDDVSSGAMCPAGGFVRQDTFFALQGRMEGIGIPTRFPHPSQLLRTIISKELYAYLCMQPELMLPACIRVNRATVLADPTSAAKKALATLRDVTAAVITKRKQYNVMLGSANGVADDDELVDIHPDGHQHDPLLPRGGVAKLGFSWEAMDVRTFAVGDNDVQSLARQMQELFVQAACLTECVLLQERVPNELELRFVTVNGEPK